MSFHLTQEPDHFPHFLFDFRGHLGFSYFIQGGALSFLFVTTNFIIVYSLFLTQTFPSAFASLEFFACSSTSSLDSNSICIIFRIRQLFFFRFLASPHSRLYQILRKYLTYHYWLLGWTFLWDYISCHPVRLCSYWNLVHFSRHPVCLLAFSLCTVNLSLRFLG